MEGISTVISVTFFLVYSLVIHVDAGELLVHWLFHWLDVACEIWNAVSFMVCSTKANHHRSDRQRHSQRPWVQFWRFSRDWVRFHIERASRHHSYQFTDEVITIMYSNQSWEQSDRKLVQLFHLGCHHQYCEWCVPNSWCGYYNVYDHWKFVLKWWGHTCFNCVFSSHEWNFWRCIEFVLIDFLTLIFFLIGIDCMIRPLFSS